MKQFYDSYFNKRFKKNEIIHKLYEIPKKVKRIEVPKYNITKANYSQQGDILMLPNDNGYRYLLVCVDIASRLCDAIPLKSKKQNEVSNAFEKIYFVNKIIKLPKVIWFDGGSEFKGSVAKFFEDNNVLIKIAQKKTQMAIVESRNKVIGRAIHMKQAAEELITDGRYTDWVDDIPIILQHINKRARQRRITVKKYDVPILTKHNYPLLKEGSHVRTVLRAPIGMAWGEKLYGKFRASDIRWDPKIKMVKQCILIPGQPPMYLLNDFKAFPVAYTKSQLQLVSENEEYPSHKILKNKNEDKKYKIEKILDRKYINGKIHYKIKWMGYPTSDSTYEPRSVLLKEVPEMIKEYDDHK